MTTFPVEGWYDCGKPETLLSTNQAPAGTAIGDLPVPGVVVIVQPVYIAPTAKHRPTA